MATTIAPIASAEPFSGLRVFQPRTLPTTQASITPKPNTFDDFNVAFQNATGWELAWNPIRDRSRRTGSPQWAHRKNHDWVRISDMSDRLPPGVPAVSRIYSENLILKLNRLLDEFGISGEKKQNGDQIKSPNSQQRHGPGILEPCFLDSVSVVPVASTPFGRDCSTGFQWTVREDGSIMVGAFEIKGSPESIHSGLVAAQASFLAASRSGSDCSGVVRQVRLAIEQIFCGDIGIHIVVWALDPLLGFATICGDDCFDIRLERGPIKADRQATTGFLWLRGQNLVLGTQRNISDDDQSKSEKASWFEIVERSADRFKPRDLKAAIQERIQQRIPRFSNLPGLALVMSRH